MGHIRDLPKSKLGVGPGEPLYPEYILVRGKGELIKKLKSAAKGSDTILLASDPTAKVRLSPGTWLMCWKSIPPRRAGSACTRLRPVG